MFRSLVFVLLIKISTGIRSRVPISSLTRTSTDFRAYDENDDFSSIAEMQKEIDQQIGDEMSSLQEEQQREPPTDSVQKSLDNIFGSNVKPEKDSTQRKIETYELMKTLLEEVQSTRDVVRKSVDMHALNMERQENLKMEMAAREDLKKLEEKITNRLENYVNEIEVVDVKIVRHMLIIQYSVHT